MISPRLPTAERDPAVHFFVDPSASAGNVSEALARLLVGMDQRRREREKNDARVAIKKDGNDNGKT